MNNLEKLVNEQADNICKTYKIKPDEVKKMLRTGIDQNQELRTLITSSQDLKDVYRTRLFKDFIKKVKKDVYYSLRAYKQQADDPIKMHISTKERAPHLNDFFQQIDGYLKSSQYILDVGGGLFPLSFPFGKYPNLKRYVWLDKDKEAYEIIQQHKHKKLVLYNFSLDENPWHYYLPDGASKFDFVFMLKLIPVLYRQEKQLLSNLAEIPTKLSLVSGSKEAMVKKQDIEAREQKVIKTFIQNSNKKVVKKIDLPNEFGYLIQ